MSLVETETLDYDKIVAELDEYLDILKRTIYK
jgi:hypothetical protein